MIVAVTNGALLVDDDHGSLGPQPAPRAIGLGHPTVHVCEQRHGQSVLSDEAFVGRQVLSRDPNHRGIERLEVVYAVAVGAELFGADHRVVAGIEEQHNALAAMLREAEVALRARKLEVWSLLTHRRLLGHAHPPGAVCAQHSPMAPLATSRDASAAPPRAA